MTMSKSRLSLAFFLNELPFASFDVGLVLLPTFLPFFYPILIFFSAFWNFPPFLG